VKVLVACEFSGIVREAFRKQGHDAWSCDLYPTEIDGPHIRDDVLRHLDENWDLMIAHPPCTHLAASGRAWFKDKPYRQKLALEFVEQLLNAPIPKIALENPISVISTKIRKPDQIIQPWQFGHIDRKAIRLSLQQLPKLTPTYIEPIENRKEVSHHQSASYVRWKRRSRFFSGIADAMAYQWGWLSVIRE